MAEIKRVWGPEVDEVACKAAGLDMSHHTATFMGSQVMLIDDWEDLLPGHRLVGISDIRNPESKRNFVIVNFSHLGFA